MLNAAVRKYLITGLTGTPDVLDGLLRDVTNGSDPLWDFRPDPDRFTLREVLAHVADWETIFRDRMWRTLQEDTPFLPDVDEGKVAVEHDYANSDPHHSLSVIREERPKLIEFLKHLPEEAWQRTAQRELLGVITLEGQAVLMLGHDGYHTQQTADYLKRFADQTA